MRDFPHVYLNTNAKTIKKSVEDFLADMTGEPATEASECRVKQEKQKLIQWFQDKRLDYLFDLTKEKTHFEWTVLLNVINLLSHLDGYIEQHDRIFGKPVDRINENLREALEDFSDEYKNDSVIDLAYAEKNIVR